MRENREIAHTFDTLADLLEIEGANPFRVRAYRNAARVVDSISQNVAMMVREGRDLSQYPGIGKDLAGKIRTVSETGTLPLLEEVEKRVPRALSELTQIEGLGPRRVKALHESLQVNSLEDLEKAVDQGRVRELPGFGARTEELVRNGLKRLRGTQGRTLIADAEETAVHLERFLSGLQGVKQVTVAGSYRRRRETVGDLDVLVTCRPGVPVGKWFTSFESVETILSQGETRSSVRLRSGLQVDLRVVPEISYGAALHYFTGSKAHNIAIRKLGMARGLRINEYGVFSGDQRIAGRTEAEVFAAVDLPFIEPELREDRGEVDAARNGRLPELIRIEDIRGDLHAHTNATDGRSGLESMVDAARERGYEYLAITDHSQAVTVAKGLDVERLRKQLQAIDRLQEQYDDIRILKGSEVDILEDGRLDLPDEILRELDITVCSVHSRFNLPEAQQTERILRAMDNPHFRILGHPSGRLLNKRDPYPMDLERIITGAVERGRFLEVNAQPDRLDLTDTACQLAKEKGAKLAISTDAHSDSGLAGIRFGIGQARRGWLEKQDVINTRPLPELLKLLRNT
ncbi:DNA polymerase/3'-5' exonuclease PolX [Thiohalomonas denitrificans]|uniref:DNA polymerase beta n=1 Tax=Thiohalomonas denitrificans TaxID=415747 RepID=A0A1G5Q159_9GAMM|nr:DNA polymerase/3'-5' exonuclease PolX [Thiohalomonas denitrificans]SCZ55584.1 DNA polymerase (family 10) [Thiohalomonas denitrificans]